MKKTLCSILSVLMLIACTTVSAFASTPAETIASEAPGNANGNIISHNETWVAPNKNVEVTVYDLGDGFTSTETITTEDAGFNLLRASGTKTQSSTV